MSTPVSQPAYDTGAIPGTRVTIVDSYMNDRVMHATATMLRDRQDTFEVMVAGGRRTFTRPREQYRLKRSSQPPPTELLP